MRTGIEKQQFEALLQQHQRILFKVANTYCRDPEDRHDLLQEMRLQLWRAFPRYDTRRTFTTWMYRIALNVAITFVRKAQQQERHTTSLDTPAVERITTVMPEPDERLGALYTVLEQLDPLNRALLLLYLEEHTYAEMAEILGISETNVATKISRLKQRIRQNVATTPST